MLILAIIAVGLALMLGYYVRDSIAEKERANTRST